MLDIPLPNAHSLKANWAPIKYYPSISSEDSITVAVAAWDGVGEAIVLEANQLNSLSCLFGREAEKHVAFVRMTLDALRQELKSEVNVTAFKKDMLGSSFVIGKISKGSGNSIIDIANVWLAKASVVHVPVVASFENIMLATRVATVENVKLPKEPKILPTIRDEISVLNPRLTANFNKEFHPKGRALPVKLGYSGEKIVASFDRMPPRSLGNSLERIRSKLWLLAEHRDQTRHEVARAHEMLVVPSEHMDLIAGQFDVGIMRDACSDMEKEADRREIRFRTFVNSHQAAQHIFSMESSGQPLSLS